jgi:gliding motility-associated-like protein
VFTITQPPASTLNLAASVFSTCVGNSIVLTGTNSGGTPGYTYTWTNGPSIATQTVAENAGGTYIYTLSSADGNNCLTSNTIAVDFVANPVLSINSVSICPLETGTLTVSGASGYLWNTAATTNSISDNPLVTTSYSVVGSALGCTSAATASIIIKPLPVPLISSNSPRCNNDNLLLYSNGGSSYSWAGPLGFSSSLQNPVLNPIGLTHAGVYDLTVTAANSCTASTSTTVVVNPTPTISATGATLCTIQNATLSSSSLPASSYHWSGPLGYSSSIQNPVLATPVVNASGQYTVKATSAVGCTNTAVANVQVVTPPSLTAQLSSHSLCSQAFNGSPNTITLTASGANTYSLVTVPDLFNANPGGPISPLSAIPPNTGAASATLSGSNGVCTLTLGLTFTIIPNPTVSIYNYTPEICAGQNFTYTNSGANSYTWNSATPNFTTYNNGGVAVANPSINSVFSVYGGSLGCNSASQTSTIVVHPIPTISITPAESKICIGKSTLLTAQGTATSFTWNPSTGLTNASGSQVTAAPLLNQSYTVTGSANHCTTTAKANITVLALPQPSATASKPAVCDQESVTLTGTGGESYHWNGPNNISYDGKIVSFKTSVNHSGVYTLTVKDLNGCSNSTTSTIHVIQLPQGSLVSDKMQGCVPFCADFNYSNSAPNASVITTTWELNRKTFSGKTFNYCFTTVGEHIITGKFKDTQTGCLNTQTVVVQGLPVPQADFRWLPETPIEGLEDVLFVNSSIGEKQETFSWFFVDNTNYKTQSENTSFFFREAGVYPVAYIVKNAYGCSDSIVKVITIAPDFNFYVPDAFTPNGDDRNEIFTPVVRGVKLYDLKIFNRWGNLIFHSTDVNNGWDGTFNSEECKQDVYVWKAGVSSIHGEAKQYSGQVTLLR